MTIEMTREVQDKLRAEFPRNKVGKLPRVTCSMCSNPKAQCSDHKRQKCRVCKAYVSTQHMHIDYVGHADVTDRLLTVDPGWNWEPMAFDSFGLPATDEHGGLWIRLTVAGVTRVGYGHADGKKGGNAIKEAIGDAIRNAAMRFGVALDLWRKESPEVDSDGTPAREVERPVQTTEERRAELRGQINTIGKTKGMKVDEIASDFTLWSGEQKLDIRSAGPVALAEYLHHLQRAEAGAS
jgi:hypothetical protein